jgi:L-ascorbate metabolism protein UlaG (beta-lactamase superfamily)
MRVNSFTRRSLLIFAALPNIVALTSPPILAIMPTSTSAPSTPPSTIQSVPDIRIHYLGHSAFILAFNNGVTILTDYGQSRSYNLDSPIYDLANFQPTIVTYSHHHADHDRGMSFINATVLNGQDLHLNTLDIKAIHVSENTEADNFGYLITYKGYTIFHAGDSQGDIVTISSSNEVQSRIKRQLPKKIDLLLLPVDWTRNIVDQAADYVGFLRIRKVIPMHYWSPSTKSEFLTELTSRDKKYTIVNVEGPTYDIFISRPAASSIEVISLTPGS